MLGVVKLDRSMMDREMHLVLGDGINIQMDRYIDTSMEGGGPPLGIGGTQVVQHVMEHSSRPGDRQHVMNIIRKNILSLSCPAAKLG